MASVMTSDSCSNDLKHNTNLKAKLTFLLCVAEHVHSYVGNTKKN